KGSIFKIHFRAKGIQEGEFPTWVREKSAPECQILWPWRDPKIFEDAPWGTTDRENRLAAGSPADRSAQVRVISLSQRDAPDFPRESTTSDRSCDMAQVPRPTRHE